MLTTEEGKDISELDESFKELRKDYHELWERKEELKKENKNLRESLYPLKASLEVTSETVKKMEMIFQNLNLNK